MDSDRFLVFNKPCCNFKSFFSGYFSSVVVLREMLNWLPANLLYLCHQRDDISETAIRSFFCPSVCLSHVPSSREVHLQFTIADEGSGGESGGKLFPGAEGVDALGKIA